jgi:UDP-N-acetylmuramyl pentapeptide phosphotransferase/UDP-N-acetylglucosamine-1-phosphate transferase
MKLSRMGGVGVVVGAVGAVLVLARAGSRELLGIGLVLLIGGALFVMIDMLFRPPQR